MYTVHIHKRGITNEVCHWVRLLCCDERCVITANCTLCMYVALSTCCCCCNYYLHSTSYSLEASFAALDTDKSGFISAQEMESSLLKLGVIGAKMTKDQVMHQYNQYLLL
jgi:hypothetical protein